jgi:hypothetical protein
LIWEKIPDGDQADCKKPTFVRVDNIDLSGDSLTVTVNDVGIEEVFALTVMGDVYYRDTFDSGSSRGWNVVSGDWSIDSGGWLLQSENTAWPTITLMGPQLENFSFEARIRFTQNNGWAALQFRKQYFEDGAESGYIANIRPDGTITLWNNTDLRLESKVTGTNPFADDVSVRVEAFGEELRVSVNGTRFLDVDNARYGPGYFGLATYQTTAKFSDITISPLDNLNPKAPTGFRIAP